MQLITGAISFFLILQLAMIGAAPTEDDIRCTCYTLLQLHKLIHLLKGDIYVGVSPSEKYLRPYLKCKAISQHRCTSSVTRSPFII